MADINCAYVLGSIATAVGLLITGLMVSNCRSKRALNRCLVDNKKLQKTLNKTELRFCTSETEYENVFDKIMTEDPDSLFNNLMDKFYSDTYNEDTVNTHVYELPFNVNTETARQLIIKFFALADVSAELDGNKIYLTHMCLSDDDSSDDDSSNDDSSDDESNDSDASDETDDEDDSEDRHTDNKSN